MAYDEPAADPLARAPELQALLRDLDGLRLSLATDLSLAAAALEAGSPEIASAVVDSDRAQLRAFEQRALHHLSEPEVPAVPALPPARARRRSLLTAATPLVASAAAVLGVLVGVVPTGSDSTPERVGPQTAMASYEHLTRLTLQGAEATEVARAAEQLHAQLAAIVAQASEDPVAAQQALALLESQARVLDSSADREALSGVIAEARTLVARLRAALPVPVRTPRVPLHGTAPDDVVLPAGVPLPPPPAPRSEPSPEQPQRTPSPSASPSPSPSSQDAPSEDSGTVLPDAVLPPD